MRVPFLCFMSMFHAARNNKNARLYVIVSLLQPVAYPYTRADEDEDRAE